MCSMTRFIWSYSLAIKKKKPFCKCSEIYGLLFCW
uniref:Uncharacterized protein n=1 Tax=Rhizophora mucronata TaxID=61149 RepID=A0A2P2QH55_RHIMU